MSMCYFDWGVGGGAVLFKGWPPGSMRDLASWVSVTL